MNLFLNLGVSSIISVVSLLITLLSYILGKDDSNFKSICKVTFIVFLIFLGVSFYNLFHTDTSANTTTSVISTPTSASTPSSAPVTEVSGESGSCGKNLVWKLDDDGTLTISGAGDMDSFFHAIANDIKNVEIEDGVTSIDGDAFAGCSNLESVKIPSSVTRIGDQAFSYCTSLTSITIPSGVKNIGNYAFDSCSSLKKAILPNSVTSIGTAAFTDCARLESIQIPSSVTSTGDWTFYNCSSLKSVEIPSSIKEIGKYAFADCVSLTSVEIPSSVKIIDDYAFSGCSSLKTIDIPSSVESIGDYAFDSCNSLTKIIIPSSVADIEDSTFGNCKSLKNIYYSGTEKQWNSLNITFNYDVTIYYNCIGDTPPTTVPVTPEPVTEPPVTTSSRTSACVKIDKNNREWSGHIFKDTATNFNVFKIGETKNCYRVIINYSASGKKNSMGTRDVYVMSQAAYNYGDDSGWIKVGSFEYDYYKGEVVTVDINWENTAGLQDVYAMAIIRETTDSNVSFDANWGDNVLLYYYTY